MNKTQYIYEVDPNRLLDVKRFIAQILNEELLGNNQSMWALDWWFNKYDRAAANSGTADSLDSIQSIATPENIGAEESAEVRRISYEQQLESPSNRRAINALYARTFNEMEGFAGENATKLSAILTKSVTTGVSYQEVAKQVNNQFSDMAGYRALRIVRTELNKAYTDAHMDNAKDLNQTAFQNKYEVRVMHISVLDPKRSRRAHMERHGKIFTMAEQEEWWRSGSNSINCLCSIADVMVNIKTGEVLQKTLVKLANDQRRDILGVKE